MLIELNEIERKLLTLAMGIASSISLSTMKEFKHERESLIDVTAVGLKEYDELMDKLTEEEHASMIAKFEDKK